MAESQVNKANLLQKHEVEFILRFPCCIICNYLSHRKSFEGWRKIYMENLNIQYTSKLVRLKTQEVQHNQKYYISLQFSFHTNTVFCT